MPNAEPPAQRTLFVVVLLVAGIKAVFLAADRQPMFFLGDSLSYIHSVLTLTPSIDRSFTYPVLIRVFGVWTGSLTPLVVAQVVASALTAVLLARALLNVFHVGPEVAVAMAAICALDPLQIAHERLVLTEAFALLALAAYLTVAFNYIASPRLMTLAAVHAIGVVLISLRFPYVPMTLAQALVLPLLALMRIRLGTSGAGESQERKARSKRSSAIAFQCAASLVMVWVLHDGYKRLVQPWSGRAPAVSTR